MLPNARNVNQIVSVSGYGFVQKDLKSVEILCTLEQSCESPFVTKVSFRFNEQTAV